MKFNHRLCYYILENTTEVIFGRGIEYFKAGRVGDLTETDKGLRAEIEGSRVYSVEFRQGPKYIKGYCSCPYSQSNSDYCKHIVAVAVARDTKLGLSLPSKDEISAESLQIDYGFGKKINAMLDDPLHADLQFLATASDCGDWVRSHAKLSLGSRIKENTNPIKLSEINSAFNKITNLGYRANFDPYFCAGEVSAIVAATYDTIIYRLRFSQIGEAALIVEKSIKFYYQVYLELIDGSDGIWVIPKVRLKEMIKILLKLGMDIGGVVKFGQKLNDEIEGWGDIFEDIGFKTNLSKKVPN
jgi:hypothetical protein